MRIALIAVGAAAPMALGQPDVLYNGGFEVPNGGIPSGVDGWGHFNTATYRPTGPAHSGSASVELPSGADFAGYTTNIFNPTTLQLYDPPAIYQGGAVTLSGWYMIPAGQPLMGANAGLKLEFRRTPPNFSVYQAFEQLTINGTTNDQWVPYQLKVNCGQFNAVDPGSTVSVLPIRAGAVTATGTVFWDDLKLVQCRADYNCDDLLTVADFGAYQTGFVLGQSKADMNGDGVLTVADFGAFQTAFAVGCP